MKKNIVTSSDFDFWTLEDQNLLINHGCYDFNKKEYAKKYKYEIINSIQSENHNSYVENYLNSVKDRIYINLIPFLNDLHSKSFNKRQWQIVIGHWFDKYLKVIYNRFEAARHIINKYSDIYITTRHLNYDFATSDNYNFTIACNDAEWNHYLYIKIFEALGFKKYRYLTDTIPNFSKKKYFTNNGARENKKKKFIKIILNSIYKIFASNQKIFLITTYLPYIDELILNIRLKNFPVNCNIIYENIDFKKNDNLRSYVFNTPSNDLFERFIIENILNFIPASYVENFKIYESKIFKNGWPKNPKIIFTSNNFEYSESFKIYVANNIIKNCLYIVGQHGASYGTSTNFHKYIEYLTSDYFFTWGWKHREKDIPAFNFKYPNNKYLKNKSNKTRLILLEIPLVHNIYLRDIFSWKLNHDYVNFEFVNNLQINIQKELIVRLHFESNHNNWREFDRWKDFNSLISIDKGHINIKKLYRVAKLIVHTYESTCFLECLSLNIPSICFWKEDFYPLNGEALLDYEELERNNIFFRNPQDASKFVNENWHDIEKWWNSDTIQNVRQKFCNKYSKSTNNPAKELFYLLSSLQVDI